MPQAYRRTTWATIAAVSGRKSNAPARLTAATSRSSPAAMATAEGSGCPDRSDPLGGGVAFRWGSTGPAP